MTTTQTGEAREYALRAAGAVDRPFERTPQEATALALTAIALFLTKES